VIVDVGTFDKKEKDLLNKKEVAKEAKRAGVTVKKVIEDETRVKVKRIR
jgi:hypothetical protein